MTDYTDLATRLADALDRIGTGVEGLDAVGGEADGASKAALSEALEAERDANAQLEERVLAIKEKQEKVVGRLEQEVAQLREELNASQLALEDAQTQPAEDVGSFADAELRAELEELRSKRADDRAELDAIISELKPLVEGAASA